MNYDYDNRFPKNVDWEATEDKHNDAFWDYCISDRGIHNEDYILDNMGDLFEEFADGLSDEEFVYEPATIPG
jgi:hypothetical protein